MRLQRLRPWIELVLLALHIVAVIFIFKVIDDRKIAGVVAGALFLEIGVVTMFLEWKWGRKWGSLAFWAAVIFFLGSAVPVMGLRLTHWEMAFDDIQWLGVTGRQLHQMGNGTYMAMILMVVVEGLRDRWAQRGARGRTRHL